ncbi:MAG TPA: hypothetical protein VM367_04230 [Pseudonocardia sp.]|jgi:hypothetical protein|nr:hypothetical protein [Pseudonocardia sp.]
MVLTVVLVAFAGGMLVLAVAVARTLRPARRAARRAAALRAAVRSGLAALPPVGAPVGIRGPRPGGRSPSA